MENTLLQYGAVGALALASMAIVAVLWKANQGLHKQILEIIIRYEKIVTDLVRQQSSIEKTLEQLQEGMAAKDLLAHYFERTQNKRE